MRYCKALCLALVCTALVLAQGQIPLNTGAPPTATIIAYNYTGVGTSTYYYWVATGYNGGYAFNSNSLQAVNVTPSVGHPLQVVYNGVAGATSYAILRTSTASSPTFPCTCLVGYGSNGSASDTGVALTSFAPNLLNSASASIVLNNTDYQQASIVPIIANQRVGWEPYGPTLAMPPLCNVSELYFATDAAAGQELYGCTAPNTWTQLGGGGTGGIATALQGGILGDVPYQYAASNTHFLHGNTAATDQVLVSHGTGTGAQAPTFSSAPAISAANMTGFPTFNQNTAGYAGGLAGGALGSLPYQSASNATAFLAGNTAASDQVLISHGSGSAALAPTLSNAPALSAMNMFNFPTFNQSTTGNSGGLQGGSIGAIVYQSVPNVTAFLAGNSAATDMVVVSHGTGTGPQAPILTNAPALSAANMTGFPSGLFTALYGDATSTSSGGATTVSQEHDYVTVVGTAQTPYTVVSGDTYIKCSAGTSTPIVINLPHASGSGRVVKMIKLDSNAASCTLRAQTGETINGTQTLADTTQYATYQVIDSAVNGWNILATAGTSSGGGFTALSGDAISTSSGGATTVKQEHDYTTSVGTTQTPYTVVAADTLLNCAAGASTPIVINLPAATGTGRVIKMVKTDSNAVACTLTPNGTDKVNGAASLATSTPLASYQIIDGASGQWYILGNTTNVGPVYGNGIITFGWDGGGSLIQENKKACVQVPYNATINGWTAFGDPSNLTGSITFNVFVGNYFGATSPPTTSIVGGNNPFIGVGWSNADLTLTGWTKTISATQVVCATSYSVVLMTKALLQVYVTKN